MKNLNLKKSKISKQITVYGLRITVLALCLCVSVVKSYGDTHYVSMDGGNVSPYSSAANAATDIQNAINAAEDGDTVLVDDGVYFPPNQLVLTNDIILRSVNGPYKTTIDGSNSHAVVSISEAEAILEGFTITHGDGFWGGGVYVFRTGTVDRCILSENKAVNGGGIFLNEGGLVKNSLIMNNSVSSKGGGLDFRLGGKAVNCTIVSNSTIYNYGGFYCTKGSLANCIIWDNYLNGKTNNYGFSDFHGGTSEFCSTFPIMNGVGQIGTPPEFMDSASGSYFLKSDSPCVNSGTNFPGMTNWFDLAGNPRILDGNVDMGCFEYGGDIPVFGELKYKQKKTKAVFKWENVEPLLNPYLDLGYKIVLKDGTNVVDGSRTLVPNKKKTVWKFKDKVTKTSVKYKEKIKKKGPKTKLIYKLPGQVSENAGVYLTQ